MNRRQFAQLATAAAAVAAHSTAKAAPQQSRPATEAQVNHAMTAYMGEASQRRIAMLLYPGMYPLDLVGPHAFLAGLPNVQIDLVAKSMEPVVTAQKLLLTPTATLTSCPKDLDVLFVPGGQPGTTQTMQDIEVLDFLTDRSSRARYVTSVCTGSLILGAAGLLNGYRATSHWSTRDILPLLGATPVDARIVEDRNRITGGGVTAGIDFGLRIVARMTDPVYAEMLQLINEYNPQPPFHAGSPASAGPAITKHLESMLDDSHAQTKQAALDARRRLGIA